MSDILLEVERLRKYFPVKRSGGTSYIHAVEDVSLFIRKGETLLIVLVACRLDAVMATSFVRDAVVIGFVCNETLSIIENAGLMGLPIPAALTKAVDILKQRSEEQKGT